MNLTNIILNEEFKKLVYKEIITAQDTNSVLYLGKRISYEMYHDILKKHFIKFYGKKPTQTDNLAFMLLLTYPKKNIEMFQTFTDLKLAFNNISEESDFESNGFTIYDAFGQANCICNENIMNAHIFRNKYSGVTIQLGSVCNKKYGLISKNDPRYKSTCKKIKEHKEKEKERNENKPEGYYENERQYKKQEKEELKLKQIEENIWKKMKKELNKLNKKNIGIFIIKHCLLCCKEGIYKTVEPFICSTCVFTEIKIKKISLNINIKQNKAYDECLLCYEEFININKKTQNLCKKCQQKWCLEKCKMCPEKFLKHKIISDLYCPDCDDNLSKCIDCHRDILKPSQRCYKCEYKFTNNLDLIICKYCKKEVYLKKGETWKKNCTDCYIKLVETKKCIISDCDNTIKVMPSETWRTKCRDCYSTNRK